MHRPDRIPRSTAAGTDRRLWWTRPRTLLWLLILFAFGLRLLLVVTAAGVLRDGFMFILQSELLTEGRWDLALRCPQHPLTAVLIALMRPLVGDWVLAGQLLSALCGALVLVPVYLLTRDIVGERAGLVAAAAAAVSPYVVRYSAEVLSDAPYWLLATAALTAGWWALSRRQVGWFALAGLLCGLAYLTRPEGLGMALVVLAGGVFVVIRGRGPAPRPTPGQPVGAPWQDPPAGGWRERARMAGCACVFLGVLTGAALPYAYVIGGPTLKKSPDSVVARLLRRVSREGPRRPDGPAAAPAVSPPRTRPTATHTRPAVPPTRPTPPAPSAPPSPAGRRGPLDRLATGLWQIIRKYPETWHYYLLLLGAIGLVRRRATTWRPGGAWYLAGVILVNLVGHLILYAAEGYVARRYAVAVGLVALPWTGAGWVELTALLVAFFGRGHRRAGRNVTVILVVILLASTLPKALRPPQWDKPGFREAGRWLADHTAPDARIMISSHPEVGPRALRVTFYAGGYPPLAQYLSRPGEPLEPPPAGAAHAGRWWPSRLPELWDLPSFPLKHCRRVIFAPGTRRWQKLLRSIHRGRIDYLVVDYEEIARRFGNFPRQAQRVPELELLKAFPVRRGKPDSIFIYKVVRPAASSSRPAAGRQPRTRPTP